MGVGVLVCVDGVGVWVGVACVGVVEACWSPAAQCRILFIRNSCIADTTHCRYHPLQIPPIADTTHCRYHPLQIPPSVPLCTNYCPIIVEHLVIIR